MSRVVVHALSSWAEWPVKIPCMSEPTWLTLLTERINCTEGVIQNVYVFNGQVSGYSSGSSIFQQAHITAADPLYSPQNTSSYASPASLYCRRDNVLSKWRQGTTNSQQLETWAGQCRPVKTQNAAWAIFGSSMMKSWSTFWVRNILTGLFTVNHSQVWRHVVVLIVHVYLKKPIVLLNFCCSLWFSWELLSRTNLQGGKTLQKWP